MCSFQHVRPYALARITQNTMCTPKQPPCKSLGGQNRIYNSETSQRWIGCVSVCKFEHLKKHLETTSGTLERSEKSQPMSAAPMMAQPPTLTNAAERQSHSRITVASLCCNADEAISTIAEPSKDYHPGGPRAFSPSAPPAQTTCRQLGHLALAATLPSLLSVNCQHHSGPGFSNRSSCVSHRDTPMASGALIEVSDSAGDDIVHAGKAASDPSVINWSTVLSQEGTLNNVLPPSTMGTTTGDRKTYRTHEDADLQVQAKTKVTSNEAPPAHPSIWKTLIH